MGGIVAPGASDRVHFCPEESTGMETTEVKAAPGILSHVGVAILFAISGALSSLVFNFGDSLWPPLALPLVALPFGVMSVLIVVRSSEAFLILPLIVAVWIAAFYSILAMYGRPLIYVLPVMDGYFRMCAVGLIGGLGLALSFAIHRRGLLAGRYLIGAAIAGAVSALPFGFWLATGNAGEKSSSSVIGLACAFAVWQATMGTYLYSACRRLNER
jgi:hypothetical protein